MTIGKWELMNLHTLHYCCCENLISCEMFVIKQV